MQLKTKISSLMLLVGSVFSMQVLAVAPSFYAGLMTGPATNSGGSVPVQVAGSPTTVQATANSRQFGTRIYIGEKFSRNIGLESGFTYFTDIKYNTGSATACSSPEARIRDLDLVGVGSIPFGGAFTAFGKVGAALVYVSSDGSLNPQLANDCGGSEYTTNVKPTFAAGLSYDLNKSWVVDVSWTRLVVSSFVNHVDLFALGLSYHFVDIECGKFFCS